MTLGEKAVSDVSIGGHAALSYSDNLTYHHPSLQPYIAQAEENTKVYQRKKLHMMEEKLHEQASALT